MFTRGLFLQAAATLLATTRAPAAQAISGEASPAAKTTLKTHRIPRTHLVVSRLAYGCATLITFNGAPLDATGIVNASRVGTAYDNGITLFDLADQAYHYGFLKSEPAFGATLAQSPGLRDRNDFATTIRSRRDFVSTNGSITCRSN